MVRRTKTLVSEQDDYLPPAMHEASTANPSNLIEHAAKAVLVSKASQMLEGLGRRTIALAEAITLEVEAIKGDRCCKHLLDSQYQQLHAAFSTSVPHAAFDTYKTQRSKA